VNRFVLDASITLTWCFPDEHATNAQYALRLLQEGAEAVAPAIWPLEVLNALLAAEKRGRITQQVAAAFLSDVRNLGVRLDMPADANPFSAGVEELARRHALTAYDAAYLELAVRSAIPLATLDDAMISAASEAGVTVIAASAK
jgi:predicted nucleic acid-binding protein